MKENRLVWFAVTLAVVALINSAVVGYLGLHSHDNSEMFKIESMPDQFSGEMPVYFPDETGLWGIATDGTIHSEDYGSYPAEVPFEPEMMLYPQWTTTTAITELEQNLANIVTMTAEEYRAWLGIAETDTTK